MDIVFVSNYYNHHQSPFSEALYKQRGIDYHFVETEKIPEERKKLGYITESASSFVMNYMDADRQRDIISIITDADVVIFGSAPEELMLLRRQSGKLTIRYSERLYKTSLAAWKKPYCYAKDHLKYKDTPKEFLLCASAFASYDFTKACCFPGKMYKWGYFPETRKYDETLLMRGKKSGSILWVGRQLDWKHPEVPILIAEKLKKEDFSFHVDIIGTGVLYGKLKSMIEENRLASCVQLHGPMTPNQVREYMEKSEIYLFSSDRNEGWGAVLNEAMNSGCAVIAGSEIGSVPYLIKDGKNGIVYKNGDLMSAYKAVKDTLLNRDAREKMGINAYRTICSIWNAEEAAKRFVPFVHRLLETGESDLYDEGPCSRAEIIKDGWYK